MAITRNDRINANAIPVTAEQAANFDINIGGDRFLWDGTPDNGTLVVTSLNFSGSNTLPDIDARSVDVDGNVTYTADANRTDGDVVRYGASALDIAGWIGEVASLPAGNFADVCRFSGNFYRFEWDGASQNDWVNRGGFPANDAGIFTRHFADFDVDITVPANQPPIATDQTVTVYKNTPTDIQLIATDPDGTVISYSISTPPTNGTIPTPGQTVTYTPDTGYVGGDLFEFTVGDDEAAQATGTITINVVEPPNELPVTKDRDIDTTIAQAVPVTLVGSDADDGAITAWVVDAGPYNGTLSGAVPDLIYTPNPDYVGDDNFEYHGVDSQGAESLISKISIRVKPADSCIYDHMLVSNTNLVPAAVLSSTAEPVTSIDWLKNEHRAQQTRWTDLSSDEIEIEVVFAEQSVVNYLAIPLSNLRADAEVKLKLFRDADDTVTIYDGPFDIVGQNVIDNGYVYVQFFGSDYVASKAVVCIRHRHAYVAPADPPPVIISDGTPKQEASGVLSIDAENGVSIPAGSDAWVQQNDGAASGGVRMAKLESQFYWSAFDGPRITFEFTATQNGLHQIWLRLRSDHGTSIYTITPDGQNYTVFSGSTAIVGLGWQWRNTRSINLTAGQKTQITIAARAQLMQLDKIIVQPGSLGQPNGVGAAQSPNGETIVTATGETPEGESLDLRMLMLGEAKQFDNNFRYGSQIKFVTDPTNRKSYAGFSLRAKRQQKARALSVDFPLETDHDRELAWRMETDRLGDAFLISAYPGQNRPDWFTGNYQMLCRLENALEHGHRYEDMHRASWVLGEV